MLLVDVLELFWFKMSYVMISYTAVLVEELILLFLCNSVGSQQDSQQLYVTKYHIQYPICLLV